MLMHDNCDTAIDIDIVTIGGNAEHWHLMRHGAKAQNLIDYGAESD